MKGPEIVAALKGIVNTTSLNTLPSEDKVVIRSLLDIINLPLHSHLSSECLTFVPTTSYGWVV